jgi:hypothetical protein
METIMRHLSAITASATLVTFAALFAVSVGVTGCSKTEEKPADVKPAYDILSTQKEELQKAKDVEKQMQIQAEEQRKVIEVQTK